MILLTAYWPTLRNNSYLVINFLPACLFTVSFHSKIVKVVLRIMSINALHSKLTQLLTVTFNLFIFFLFQDYKDFKTTKTEEFKNARLVTSMNVISKLL